MPEAMNFRCSVTMATRPNQNNNKGRIQANGKKYSEKAIQMKLYKNDSYKELCELFHINVIYLKENRDTYLRETQCSNMLQETSQRHHISNKYDHQNLCLALPLIT